MMRHTLQSTVLILLMIPAASSLIAAAVPAPPRVPAEWEPALGAMVAWPPIVPETLLVEIARDDQLFLLVSDEGARSEAEAAIGKLSIARERIRFIVTEAGSARPWPRDWGPFPLFDGSGEFQLADPRFLDYPFTTASCDSRLYTARFIFLDEFTKDDAATEAIAHALHLSRLPLPFTLTGGNTLVDGHGTAFSTCVLLNENRRALGIAESDLRQAVQKDLGISRHVIVPNFEWIGIQHIDCLMKPLDEETLLVKRVPARHPDHEAIESIAALLAASTGPYGRPYRIVRIDTPPYLLDYFVANYTNSLILNHKVLVPLFGIPADDEALAIFRKEMPGYEVIGFRNPGRAGWNWMDALHCRVRAVWDPGMLYMSHRRVQERVEPRASYEIDVRIRDYSRAGVVPGELKLAWRLREESSWRQIPLQAASEEDLYTASIPNPGPGRTVDYYLVAADRSGRRETLPRTAPKGFYSFSILPPAS